MQTHHLRRPAAREHRHPHPAQISKHRQCRQERAQASAIRPTARDRGSRTDCRSNIAPEAILAAKACAADALPAPARRHTACGREPRGTHTTRAQAERASSERRHEHTPVALPRDQ